MPNWSGRGPSPPTPGAVRVALSVVRGGSWRCSDDCGDALNRLDGRRTLVAVDHVGDHRNAQGHQPLARAVLVAAFQRDEHAEPRALQLPRVALVLQVPSARFHAAFLAVRERYGVFTVSAIARP